jgi:beta-lactamase regulating signal transducer with metallopeptidase domain
MIVLTILNTLLPAVAVTAMTWFALRLLRVNAATRYLAWWAVLAAIIAMLFWPVQEPMPLISTSLPVPTATPITVEPRVDLLFWAAFSWGLYAQYRLTRIAVSYAHLRGLIRRAAPLDADLLDSLRVTSGISRRATLLASVEIVSPMAVGYFQPSILVPYGLFDRLTPSEREHVLLHELAHIARYDDWTKLAARLLKALLGLHPVAAFVLAHIEAEREHACDDWVVASTGDARSYAASLAHVFELSRG